MERFTKAPCKYAPLFNWFETQPFTKSSCKDAKYYGTRPDDEKRPYPEDIARVARLRVLIEIKLKEQRRL